ncbi:rhodanese-like domain-containing protein [Lacticigenium naphthae]|uniref:rhodanese-like domain-containing protein n=1 Tax=Lacticigenium naphthae TaxID=515351 RepID=UPI00040E112A|nr:rhodanese-like domain-containing protein [Lacticigenium naphthae]
MFFSRMPSISTKELEQKLSEKIELIDVRETNEFANGHIPRAKNIPLGKIDKYKPNGTVYVICQSGMRSKRAAKILKAKDCDVVNVKGGMSAWSGKTRGGKL